MMKKRLCNFLGLVLALSLMIPSGAIKAIAEEVTPAQTSSETTASSSATTISETEKKKLILTLFHLKRTLRQFLRISPHSLYKKMSKLMEREQVL